MSKKGLKIPTHKTPQSQRGTFVFHSVTEDITITTAQVSAKWIHTEHNLDDSEVNNNCNEGHPPLTDKEKAEKKAWEEAHPGEDYPANWHVSLTAKYDDADMDEDKQPIYEEIRRNNPDGSDDKQKEWLHDTVTELSREEQLLYQLRYKDELTIEEIVPLYGKKKSAVGDDLKKLTQHLIEIRIRDGIR